MRLGIVAAVFPVIFVGELPDKTMFASLLLSSRGRPLGVWLGAATAFAVHVVIAVTVGVALFHAVGQRWTAGVVAVLFAGGAVYALIESRKDPGAELAEREAMTHSRAMVTALVVVFLAEWGDLTQILTASLAAHYHSPLSVGLGSLLALWAVAGVAVIGGGAVLRRLPVRTLRIATAVALLGLAAWAAWEALR